MGDEKGSMGGNAGGRDEGSDARMGMIQINDLVYKLETDLSVAINRTHKTQFFQNIEYTNTQTSIAILNSGADYIDPRRSFLSFDLVVPPTVWPDSVKDDHFYKNAFVSYYFGKNGSVLNLIDSVTVSTRSGDELSRINDYGQLMNILLPEMFGDEWKNTVGQEIGLGSFIGGSNNATAPVASEQRRQKFVIPLYLMSPVFNYGRLMPSMLMSGLRIEIKWKPLDVACQYFYENMPLEYPADGSQGVNHQVRDDFETEFKAFLWQSTSSSTAYAGNGAIFPEMTTYKITGDSGYDAKTVPQLVYTSINGSTGTLEFKYLGTGDFAEYVLPGDQGFWYSFGTNPSDPRYKLRNFVIGDIIVMSNDNTIGAGPDGKDDVGPVAPPPKGDPLFGIENRFTIVDFSADGNIAYVTSAIGSFTSPGNGVVLDGLGAAKTPGPWRLSRPAPLPYQRRPGGGAYHNKFTLPLALPTTYKIQNPEIAMCCVQLTDAIQRTLNELSAVNGLEIVYADWDRTSTPLNGNKAQPIYTEVRKSASRALMVACRIVRSTANPQTYDSFASCSGSYWNHWQVQLGSLYFPQQRVENGNSDDNLRRDAILALSFSYTQDAFDRYHPKAAPAMVSLRGTGIDFNLLDYHPLEVHAEHGPSSYLAPYSAFGKWGSYVNGGTTIAVTLERSTLFDLSGVPINNSRTLAVRGECVFTNDDDDANLRATLYVFLKYVRLARVFLVNAEVEQ